MPAGPAALVEKSKAINVYNNDESKKTKMKYDADGDFKIAPENDKSVYMEKIIFKANGVKQDVLARFINVDTNITDLQAENSTQQTAIDLNTDKAGITSDQANAIVANTAKVGITTTQANDIVANNLKTGITNTQTSNINTNNAKVGISTSQANSITSLNDMLEKDGNDTVLKTGTGNKIKFSVGGQNFFNSNEIKNLIDNVLISSNVNINTLDTNITDLQAENSTQQTAIDLNTDKVGITSDQTNAIVANTAKVGITTTQANDIVANNLKTGITNTQTSNINTNNAKVGISTSQANSITSLNDMLEKDGNDTVLKTGTGNKIKFSVGGQNFFNSNEIKNLIDNVLISSNVNINTLDTNITDLQAENSTQQTAIDLNTDNVESLNNLNVTQNTAIALNTDKVGITSDQANAIVANTAKVGITTTQANDIVANNLKTGITNTQTSNINTNNAKVGISTTQINAIVANTAKVGITTTQANDIVANNLRTGITNTQTSNINTNNAKVGISTTQINAINANTAKVGISTSQANSITSLNDMLQKDGNDTVLKTTGANIQFYQNDSQLFNSNEIKNLVDNITVSQAVDLDTMESNIATNNAKVGISTTQINAINANTAKVTSNWTINGASEIHRNSNVGIKNSNPNVDLEIGDGTSNPVRLRLNGSNGAAISSEIIFTDNKGGANPEFYNGASIRFNSYNNRLEFLTDGGNDGVAERAMYIIRDTTPYITTTNILSDDLSVQSCNLKPLSVYCYGRRVNSLTDTDNDITLSTAGVDVVYRNILTNGIVYNTSTGVFTVPSTALYEITASVQIDCGSGSESIINIILKDSSNNNRLKARGHVSRAESNSSTATQLNMIGMIRLETGTDYNFVVASKNTGTGTIQNDIATANTLIIKGVVLHNSTSVPSNWGEAV